jgi:hypothetical protein
MHFLSAFLCATLLFFSLSRCLTSFFPFSIYFSLCFRSVLPSYIFILYSFSISPPFLLYSSPSPVFKTDRPYKQYSTISDEVFVNHTGDRVEINWQWPLSDVLVHFIMMVNSAQTGAGGGESRPPPFILPIITSKVVVYAPDERAKIRTLLLFLLYPSLLCGQPLVISLAV